MLFSVSRVRWIAVFAIVLSAISVMPALAAQNPTPPEELQLPPPPDGVDASRLPGTEDIAKGVEQAEREEEEREAWLQSPQAVQEREASRFAYGDLGAAEARDLVITAFAEQLAQLNRDPIRVLSDAQLISSSEEHSATIKDEGDGMVLESSVPVRTEDEQGELRKADVSLGATADGYETENALVDVEIPESVDEPIEVGDEGVAIKLAGADDDRLARPLGDENVFAPDVLPDTDLLISPIATGVEIFNILRSENSPETLRYQVQMPAGAELRVSSDWGAEVVKDGETLTTIPDPVAVDAQGTDVPVELAVEGNLLVLTAAHRSGDYAMPILVDPILENEENWMMGQNHDTLAFWSYLTNQNIVADTHCIYECFGPGGTTTRGLFVSLVGQRSYPAGSWGQWSYSAPNIHSYVKDVTLGFPYVHADHGCSEDKYPFPKNYFGIWSANLQSWVYLSVNSANQPGGTYGLPYSGDSAVFGLTTGGADFFPCWRDLYAGGATLWLDDWNDPWVESVSGIPNGWINSTTPVNITATIKDDGLGVQNAVLWGEGSGIVHDVPVQTQCSGTRRSLCPTTYGADWGNNGLTGASFREGIRPAWLGGFDATGKAAGSHQFQMYVDGTRPEVTLEGALAEETNEVGSQEVPAGKGDELTLPVYNLKIEAKDGSWASLQDYRSGVKDIEVFVDDVKQDVPWLPTPSCAANCSRVETYPLKLSKLTSAGKHKLKVLVSDFADNVRERNIEFEYFPATGMKDEYVMQYFPLPDGTGNEAEEEHPQRPELAVNVMNGNLVYRETDIDVEGTAALDLEVERYYNSQLPSEENSEWGDGWTLAQTPELEPEKAGGSPVPNEAEIVDSSGVVEGGIELPTQAGSSKFDPELQATVTKKETGGYELTDETGESPGSVAFDATGQAEALLSDGYAKVDYGYEGGKLSEIEVSDPATFSADPSELEIPEPELITSPAYVSAFSSQGSAFGQLQNPVDAAVDSQGNVWIVDYTNSRIEKFDPEGKFISSLGSYGLGNGQFVLPTAIAVAPNGDLLVADAGNARVQRFTSAGAFVFKFGSYGTGNGQFEWARGIAVDASGNIWVSDSSRGRLQKFSPNGVFLQSVGTKGSGPGQLGAPGGIDIAPNGDVWVADWENNRVSVFSPAGVFLRSIGSAGSGDGQFKLSGEIEIDKLGNVWIGDWENNRIQQFDLAGQFKGSFGPFAWAAGIAADSKGHLWAAEYNGHRVQQWQVPIERPAYIGSFGSGGAGEGQLQAPGDVAVGIDGSLWVADKSNNRIQHLDSGGKFLATFGTLGPGDGQFNRPTAIAVDRDGNLLVADSGNDRVQKFSREGQFISKFGTAGSGNGQFSSPEGIVADLAGNIWVADSGNGRIQKFSEEGEFLAVVGSKGSGDGQLEQPIGLDVDPNGNLWVADLQNDRVSVFQPDGAFAAQVGGFGSGPGQFNRPSGVEVDSRGNVWVADQANQRVQRFDLEGNFVGQFGTPGSGEGQFSFPTATAPAGIAADKSGAIWVTDVDNHRIQRWQLGNYEVADPEPLDLNDGDAKVEVETSGGLVDSVEGNAAGTHDYVHSGDDLTAHIGPDGESKYEYDTAGRMTKVTLPNGTWGLIAYTADGRVQSVTVDPAGAVPAKKTEFEYRDAPSRRTTVYLPDAPHITYDIGRKGDVFKWWNTLEPPTIEPLMGTLFDAREKAVISAGMYYLNAKAYSPEGIASINVIADGNVIVDKKTCVQDPNKPGLECVYPLPENEWVMETEEFSPGIHWIEVLVTDRIGGAAAERFWVNIPPPPPPSIGAPVEPKFRDIKKFREDYGLEVVFPVANEVKQNERIFNLIGAWNNPHSPAGEVARASWERWGVPLRQEDVAEMEYREWVLKTNAERLAHWNDAVHSPTYAGYYMDHRAGGIMHIGFLHDQDAELANLASALPLVGSERLAVYPVMPSISFDVSQSTSDAVMNELSSDPSLAALVTSVMDDESGGPALVGTQHVQQVEQLLNEQMGSNAPIDVEYVPPAKVASGRYRISGRMRAGDSILNRESTAKSCTAGFGAYHEFMRGPKLVRAEFVLTAGHCFRLDEPVYRSEYADFSYENRWHRIGHVGRSGYAVPNAEGVRTDAETIRIEGSGDIAPRVIFGWDGVPIETRRAGRGWVNHRVCFSGAKSQTPSCGKIIARDRNGEHDGETGFESVFRSGGYWVEFEHTAIPGDSGAPVWDAQTGAAIGLATAIRWGTQTLVEPLLHPPNMSPRYLPGILHHPDMAPLNLRLRGE